MALDLLQLGDYAFNVDSAAYQTIRSAGEWRWSESQRIGRKTALQYSGAKTETKTLNGVIYPFEFGGHDQIEKMKVEANKGEPLLLVDGYGNVMGDWVIKRIEHTGSYFIDGGAPRKIEFVIELQEYGNDQ